MAVPIPNEFASFSLSEEEELSGRILNGMNILVLQNKLAQIATQKLNSKCTPQNVAEYMQEDAYLQGQLDILKNLLEDSLAAQEELQFQIQQLNS
jgi:hypothetical protein